MQTKFKEDVTQEEILTPIIIDIMSDYLTDYELEMISFKDNEDLQYHGVDFIMNNKHNTDKWNVDVKCQTNEYINNPTPTFSLELNYILNGEKKIGWFLKKDNITDYYLFTWIHKANVTDNIIQHKDEIEIMDCMLVYKPNIYEYLKTQGYKPNILLKEADDLRKSNQSYKYIESPIGKNDIKLVCSKHLAEKPVNIILNKTTYLELPKTKYFIYSKEYGFKRTSRLYRKF